MTLGTELQYLSDLYETLRRRLFDCGGASARQPYDAVLSAQELISRVAQLDARLSQLARDWQQGTERVDPSRRLQIETIAADVSSRLLQLQQVCGTHARRLDEVLQETSLELGELERGSRYLATVRPVKENHPKFVDSTG